MLLQDVFCKRPFNLALLKSRMARFVADNMGITPRNVRSEGSAPFRCSRLPNTQKHPTMNTAPGIQYAIKDLRSATICAAKSNSSFDIGSRLRNLSTTTLALPTSSLIGVGGRSRNRFTNTEAKAANTKASTKAGMVRLPNKPKFIHLSSLSDCQPSAVRELH